MIASVLNEVASERARQEAKWGVQNHVDVDPVLMGRPGGCSPQRMAEEYEIPTAGRAKQLCQFRGSERFPDTWAHVLIEEVAEAVEAAVTGDGLREELVQIAAVAVAWIEAIDRRPVAS